MTEAVQKTQWALSQPQLAFYQSDARNRAFISGVGAGKTSAGWMAAVTEACVRQPGSLGLIITPTYQMMEDIIWREKEKWLTPAMETDFNRNRKLSKIFNGSEIMYRSADNPRQIERLRGIEVAWIWIEEAALLQEGLLQVLLGRLRQPGMEHRLWITSTPRGYNWIYKHFIEGAQESRQGHGSIYEMEDHFAIAKVPSSTNTFLPEGYVESLQRQYTGAFARQEIYGEFVKLEGLIYPEFVEDIHVGEYRDQPYKTYLYGYDSGFTNPRVVLKIGVDSDGKNYVLEEFYRSHTHVEDAIGWLDHHKDHHGIVYADSSAPDDIARINQSGWPCYPATHKVLGGIQKVKSEFANNRLFIDQGCTNLIKELGLYRWKEAPAGRDTKNFPDEPFPVSDHGCDSLRYALHGKDKGGELTFVDMGKVQF